MTMHDVARFHRDLNSPTRDIHNFVNVFWLNDMEIQTIIQSEPMKLKPSPHHAAASPLSDWLTAWWDGWKEGRNEGMNK